MSPRRRAVILSASLLTALAGAFVIAGPLTPPAGPITSTYKTLTEVEPRAAINAVNTPGDADSLFKITQPGSYYLTGNITGISGKHGIEIAVGGVTIDLAGFEVAGVPGSLSGIAAPAGILRGITIRNGTFRAWGQSGIDIPAACGNVRIDGIHTIQNSAFGLSATAPGSVVTDCTAYQSIQQGIQVGDGAVVERCALVANGTGGINAGNGAVIKDCTFRSNPGQAIAVINTARILDCVVDGGGNGIFAVDNAVITGCMVASTTGNQAGIRVQNAGLITGNTCSGTVGGGIRAATNCTITENTCTGSTGGPGVACNSGCRVVGNLFNGSFRGLDVSASGNFIARNTARTNTINWVIAAGNTYGPIISASAGAAVSGSTAAGSPATSDPNANFTY